MFSLTIFRSLICAIMPFLDLHKSTFMLNIFNMKVLLCKSRNGIIAQIRLLNIVRENIMSRGYVRIIGGKWRSRRITIPSVEGVRPTSDRMRETLFNWLAPVIVDRHCLDLFAGGGALGFEALSRGAASLVMVDQSAAVVDSLREQCRVLIAEHVQVYCAAAPQQLRQPAIPFDLVFLDPPYQSPLLLASCFYLAETPGMLAVEAYIYLETDKLIQDNDLPVGWKIIKSQRAGQAMSYLVKV